jgi:hypothetical protein
MHVSTPVAPSTTILIVENDLLIGDGEWRVEFLADAGDSLCVCGIHYFHLDR